MMRLADAMFRPGWARDNTLVIELAAGKCRDAEAGLLHAMFSRACESRQGRAPSPLIAAYGRRAASAL